PTLANVFGRSKGLLKHADDSVSIFYIRGYEFHNIANFDEYRIRQVDVKRIVLEIGGEASPSPDEVTALGELIKRHAGDEFEVEVRPVAKIDWGRSIKRLAFYSEVM